VLELSIGVFTEKVSDSIIICIKNEAGKIIVLTRRTLELLVVTRATYCRTGFSCISWTRSARCNPW